MRSSWPPTFNVLYVRGSVHVLLDFVRSLSEHSSYRFRLVSNGCTAAEEAFLAKQATGHGRLEVSSLETNAILSHGEALQRLFEAETSDHYAFIDSDIFATGPFLSEAEALLARHAALFAGAPVWQAPAEQVMPAGFAFMSGRFSRTDAGLCLGVSYCAIYRRADLESVMSRSGVTFHRRGWSELSAEQRSVLAQMKLAKRRYDTGKLVNLMLARAGFSLAMQPEPNLVHVGGQSSEAMRPSGLVGRIVGRARELVDASWPGSLPRRSARERATTRGAFERRRLVGAYVQHLLAGGAADGGPLTSFPDSVRKQLEDMGRELVALRQRYATHAPPATSNECAAPDEQQPDEQQPDEQQPDEQQPDEQQHDEQQHDGTRDKSDHTNEAILDRQRTVEESER